MLRQPRDSRKPVEARVKRQDLLDSVLLHHCQVYDVASGEELIGEDNLFGALGNAVSLYDSYG